MFGDGSASGGTNFTDSTPDTITLGGTQLDLTNAANITGSLTIVGPGRTCYRSAATTPRGCSFWAAASASLSGLTVTGGSAGGSGGGGLFNRRHAHAHQQHRQRKLRQLAAAACSTTARPRSPTAPSAETAPVVLSQKSAENGVETGRGITSSVLATSVAGRRTVCFRCFTRTVPRYQSRSRVTRPRLAWSNPGLLSFAGVRQAPSAVGVPPRLEADAMGVVRAGAGDGDLAADWRGRRGRGRYRQCWSPRDGAGSGGPQLGQFGTATACGARGSAVTRPEHFVGGRRGGGVHGG